MMNEAVPTPDNSNKFVRHQLPLILFAVALISFNFLLNFFLRSDNPRPDLEQVVSENVEAIASDAVTPVDGQLAITPVEGDLGVSGWQVISGNWVAESGGLRQTGLEEFDQSIVYTARKFETFAVDAMIRHQTNVGAGILFNMQRTDTVAGSQLVRFEADGSALYWGYFDENREFTGQGFAPISTDLMQSNRLVVKSHATNYEIWLNDSLVVENIPLQWKSGHVGLAVSQADVLFEGISVMPIDGVGTAPAQSEELISQAETISGEWIYEADVIRQVQNEATDYMTSLNVLGRSYRLEATISMGDEESPADNGAGFIFHMNDRASRAGATMVRFIDHGELIVWGNFDEQGVFQGSGNLTVDTPLNEPIDLALRVGAQSFDILVNGEERVSDVPLKGNEGWIGLVAFRGDVSFSDVRLSIGEY